MSEDPNANSGGDPAQGNTDAGAGAGGSAAPSFIESLPEDLRGSEPLKAFESAEKLARAHLDALAKIPVVPDKAEAYQLTIPDGHPASEQLVNQFKGWAFEAGLTQEQVARLGANYMAAEASIINQMKQADAEAQQAIRTEWGDKFEANTEVAKKAVLQFCTKEEVEYLNESRLGNNPTLVRMFWRIGQAMSEDKLFQGGPGIGGATHMERTSGGTPQLSFPSMEKKQ
jgi:hypothetical protein